jgi:hypothetical protein
MNKLLFYILLFLFCAPLQAQINELGVFLGGSNSIADVGNDAHIAPNEFAFGVIYKWNRSTRHAYRFSYMQSKITGQDAKSESPGRRLRDYDFENQIKEISAGLEFNFFSYDLHDLDRQFTPYVFTGVSLLVYDEKYMINGTSEKDFTSTSWAIPVGLGIKSSISPSLILALEVGARYSFTDNLDGSNPKNENLAPLRFGNINSKDWYVFTGITLTYTFGEKPCFCAD